jgi:alpha-aminoadipate carrier protein LysW
MATCSECAAEMDIDEFDVDRGDVVSCPECGSNLTVTHLTPVELELFKDDDDGDDADIAREDDGE